MSGAAERLDSGAVDRAPHVYGMVPLVALASSPLNAKVGQSMMHSSTSYVRLPARLFTRMALPCMVLVGAAGCSDSGSSSSSSGSVKSDSGVDAGDSGLSSVDATSGDDGGAVGCNTLTQLGAQVTAVGNPAKQPTGTGGAVADGTYVLKAVALHGLPSAVTNPAGALTAAVEGTTMNTVSLTADGVVARTTYSIEFKGVNFKLTETCRVSNSTKRGAQFDSGTYTFDGTTNTVSLFTSLDNNGVAVPAELTITKP